MGCRARDRGSLWPPSDGIGILGRPPAERHPQERDGGNHPLGGGRLPYFNRFVRLLEKQAIRTSAEGQPAPGPPKRYYSYRA